MKRNDYFIIAFAGIVLAAIFITPADGAQITNAFSRIFIDGINVFNAKSYNDQLRFVSGSGIALTASSPNTIEIASTAGPGGDTNTAQIGDAGTHLSIFGSRFNATKNLLKTITCTGATCSANTTDILIAVSSSGGNATSLNDLSDVAGVNNTKGNIFFANGGYWTGFKVGSNGQVLMADSTVAAGIKWSTVSSTLKVDNQTVNRKQFAVGLNNATGDWTMRTFALNNQTIQTGDYFVNGINNQTGVITTKQFSVNTQATTCSGSDKVSAVSINNATGAVTITCSTVTASGGATSLAANVTGTNQGTDYLVWTIPLTANSGNTIKGVITATSSTTGNAVRGAANLTTPSGAQGYCQWTQITTTTANVVDNLVLNSVLTGRATNTGETLWIGAAGKAMPITFNCSISAGATPGNLRIFINPEITGTTAAAKAGSFYIKTP